MVEDNEELFKDKLKLIYKNYEYFSKIPLVKETIIQVPDEVLLRLDDVLERLYDDVPDGVDEDYSIRNDIMINAFCFYLKIANSLKDDNSHGFSEEDKCKIATEIVNDYIKNCNHELRERETNVQALKEKVETQKLKARGDEKLDVKSVYYYYKSLIAYKEISQYVENNEFIAFYKYDNDERKYVINEEQKPSDLSFILTTPYDEIKQDTLIYGIDSDPKDYIACIEWDDLQTQEEVDRYQPLILSNCNIKRKENSDEICLDSSINLVQSDVVNVPQIIKPEQTMLQKNEDFFREKGFVSYDNLDNIVQIKVQQDNKEKIVTITNFDDYKKKLTYKELLEEISQTEEDKKNFYYFRDSKDSPIGKKFMINSLEGLIESEQFKILKNRLFEMDNFSTDKNDENKYLNLLVYNKNKKEFCIKNYYNRFAGKHYILDDIAEQVLDEGEILIFEPNESPHFSLPKIKSKYTGALAAGTLLGNSGKFKYMDKKASIKEADTILINEVEKAVNKSAELLQNFLYIDNRGSDNTFYTYFDERSKRFILSNSPSHDIEYQHIKKPKASPITLTDPFDLNASASRFIDELKNNNFFGLDRDNRNAVKEKIGEYVLNRKNDFEIKKEERQQQRKPTEHLESKPLRQERNDLMQKFQGLQNMLNTPAKSNTNNRYSNLRDDVVLPKAKIDHRYWFYPLMATLALAVFITLLAATNLGIWAVLAYTAGTFCIPSALFGATYTKPSYEHVCNIPGRNGMNVDFENTNNVSMQYSGPSTPVVPQTKYNNYQQTQLPVYYQPSEGHNLPRPPTYIPSKRNENSNRMNMK